MKEVRSMAAMPFRALVLTLAMCPLAASSQTRVPSALGASRADPVQVGQGVAPARATRAPTPAGSANVGPDTQMSMMGLQSVVSKRQNEVQPVTDRLGGRDQGMQQVTNDIDGDGGRPPCPSCTKARRATR